jgi:hypothetical protein
MLLILDYYNYVSYYVYVTRLNFGRRVVLFHSENLKFAYCHSNGSGLLLLLKITRQKLFLPYSEFLPRKPANEVTSYRPISLLPIPSKIFEKLLLNIIRNDTEIQDITPDYQFGFREHHSTIQQTHRIVNIITASLEKKTILHSCVSRYCPGL